MAPISFPMAPQPLKFSGATSWLILLQLIFTHFPGENTFISAATLLSVFLYVHKRTVNNVKLVDAAHKLLLPSSLYCGIFLLRQKIIFI